MSPSADERPAGRAVWARLAVLVVLLAAAAAVAGVVGLPDPAQLRADIAAAGPVAPALFVLVYAVATLAPLPKNVFAVVAGDLTAVDVLEGRSPFPRPRQP